MAYDFFAGDGFNYIGTLAFFDDELGAASLDPAQQPDYSQWAVAAGLYTQDGQTQVGTLTVTNNSVITDATSNGKYTVNASSQETTKWPAGKVQLLVRAWPPHGDPITADPIWIRVKANPAVNLQGGSN
ncbi:hypothetical protein [Paraburkholderia graminis]